MSPPAARRLEDRIRRHPRQRSLRGRPFASPLLAADAGLDTFAFGGAGICSPCFADGSIGIPLHLPSGDLVQGMAGPEEPGPAAKPDGYVAKHLSADGTHLVFGSTSLFAPGGNDDSGDVSIYDRNLNSGETHVVSNRPSEDSEPLPAYRAPANATPPKATPTGSPSSISPPTAPAS